MWNCHKEIRSPHISMKISHLKFFSAYDEANKFFLSHTKLLSKQFHRNLNAFVPKNEKKSKCSINISFLVTNCRKSMTI